MTSFLRFRSLLITLGLLLSVLDTRAESLGFSSLKANEAIVIGFMSQGCFHYIERKYVVRGGERLKLEIYERKTYERSSDNKYSGPEHLLLQSWLSKREVRGLDSYLYYLRIEREGWCTTVEDITLGYYRNDVKIGEDHFRDETCALGIYRSEGKLVYDEKLPFGISESVYKSIVTPWLIEQRIMEQLKPE